MTELPPDALDDTLDEELTPDQLKAARIEMIEAMLGRRLEPYERQLGYPLGSTFINKRQPDRTYIVIWLGCTRLDPKKTRVGISWNDADGNRADGGKPAFFTLAEFEAAMTHPAMEWVSYTGLDSSKHNPDYWAAKEARRSNKS